MSLLQKEISELKNSFIVALEAVQSESMLEQVRIDFLGRKGKIAHLMDRIIDLSVDEKRIVGPLINDLKKFVQEVFDQKKEELEQKKIQHQYQQSQSFDITAYAPTVLKGTLHPLTILTRKIETIFMTMGFQVIDGPEIETDYYNFEALNIPKDHPARDMWDTFWLDIPNLLLRTHTSSAQVHAMEIKSLPLSVVSIGRCYRHEGTDASHDFVFMQLEGLFIDEHVSVGNLLATVEVFFQSFFNKTLPIRVRPSYFPFVEPGIEIDIQCPFCTHGCSVCKQSRWIEASGAGLVHPRVLESCGIDSKRYSGFAFGMGLTRLAMVYFGINDIRLLHSAKLDFLNQF